MCLVDFLGAVGRGSEDEFSEACVVCSGEQSEDIEVERKSGEFGRGMVGS